MLINLMLAIWCSSPETAMAQDVQPNRTDSQKAGRLTERTSPVGDDEMVVYKTVGDVEIKAWVKLPQGRGPFPVMIYIHGGGWLSAMAQGRPSSFSRMSAHMARLGIAGVQIFYRGKQTVTINETAAEVMDAVEWVRKNAAKYSFGLTRLGLAGSSPGAWLPWWGNGRRTTCWCPSPPCDIPLHGEW